MNDDALAAVLAAAQLLLARRAGEPPTQPVARWALAARIRIGDAAGARCVARARSRWTIVSRLHG